MGCHTLRQVSCAFLFGSCRSIVAIVAGTTGSLKEHVLSAGARWSEREVALKTRSWTWKLEDLEFLREGSE